MKLDDLNRILLSDQQVIPSSSFKVDVMARIQAEASPRFESPFPWIPITLMALPLMVLCVLLGRADPALSAMHHLFDALSKWIMASNDPALSKAIQTAFASLLGTLMLTWLSFRLMGANR